MSLFSLIAAFLLEQFQPLSAHKFLSGLLPRFVEVARQFLNSVEAQHSRITWLLTVLPMLAVSIVLYRSLYSVHPVIAWAFNVFVLYLTMGFRQFSHYFSDIQRALVDGRLEDARGLLSEWRGEAKTDVQEEEISRLAIEQALLASLHNVFGVIVWFILFGLLGLGGATGALLYRLGNYLVVEPGREGNADQQDGDQEIPEKAELGEFANRALNALDWAPVRLTAMTFAMVGNFEDTIYCWKSQAGSWADRQVGILLSSGAGALGVKLGMAVTQPGTSWERPELGVGYDADAAFMQSTVGLVWRSVVFWLVILLLISLANIPS